MVCSWMSKTEDEDEDDDDASEAIFCLWPKGCSLCTRWYVHFIQILGSLCIVENL